MIFLAPLAGRWYDRAGGRPPLVAGYATLLASAVILAWSVHANAYLPLLPGLLLYGVGLALVLQNAIAHSPLPRMTAQQGLRFKNALYAAENTGLQPKSFTRALAPLPAARPGCFRRRLQRGLPSGQRGVPGGSVPDDPADPPAALAVRPRRIEGRRQRRASGPEC